MKSEVEIMDVDVRKNDDGREFGIIEFGDLMKTAKRITNNPNFATKMIGKKIEGQIVGVPVKPYTFENAQGESVTANIRNVVQLGSETVEVALAAYRTSDGERFELADAVTEESTQDLELD